MYTPTSPREELSKRSCRYWLRSQAMYQSHSQATTSLIPRPLSGLRMKLLQCMPHLAKEREELAGSCILICFLLLLLLLLPPPPLLLLLLLHTKTLQASLHKSTTMESSVVEDTWYQVIQPFKFYKHMSFTSSSDTASGWSMIQLTSSCIRDSSPVFGGISHLEEKS